MLSFAALEDTRGQLLSSLPAKARWLLGETPLEWRFERAQQPLQPLTSADISSGAIPAHWLPIHIFGEYSYADGGGATAFLGIDIQTGQVRGLDVERDDSSAVFLLNSTVQQFIDTFLLFSHVLVHRSEAVAELAANAKAIDPAVFPNSSWRVLADHVETLPIRA